MDLKLTDTTCMGNINMDEYVHVCSKEWTPVNWKINIEFDLKSFRDTWIYPQRLRNIKFFGSFNDKTSIQLKKAIRKL